MLPDELAAAIRAAPDDPAGYTVLGDWLQERGREHGELVALMTRPKLADPADHLELIRALQRNLAPAVHGLRVDWRWGFVRRLYIQNHVELDAARGFLKTPAAAFVRDLVIEDTTQARVDFVVEQAPRLGALRSLVLDTPVRTRKPVELDALWPALPQLVRVHVRAPRRPCRIALPNARELGVHVMSDRDVAAFAEHDLPELATLALVFGGRTPLAGLRPERLPQLRHVALYFADADTLIAPTVDAAITRQLDVLEIWRPVPMPVYIDRFEIDRRAASTTAALVVTGAAQTPIGSVVPLTARWTFIGRGTEECAVHLDECSGRRHASIQQVDGDTGRTWWLEDMSRNGTFVNGREVDRVQLSDGDEITVVANAMVFAQREATLARALAGLR